MTSTAVISSAELASILGEQESASLPSSPSLAQLSEQLSSILSLKSNAEPAGANNITSNPGRIGPPRVGIHADSLYGHVDMRSDIHANRIDARSAFLSFHAGAGVNAGKWMFEALLLSSGKMQIGFCTFMPVFSTESGVGDLADSYAFDGNEVRKWNSGKSSVYGEAWACGDIIGCMIDADAGTISFARNGRNLGVAFKNLQRDGLHYFPGASMINGERATFNFGAKPFAYPVAGYQPFAAPPLPGSVNTVQYLLESLSRLNRSSTLDSDAKVVVADELIHSLVPYLVDDAAMVAAVFVPFLRKLPDIEISLLITLLSCLLDPADLLQLVSLTMSELGYAAMHYSCPIVVSADNGASSSSSSSSSSSPPVSIKTPVQTALVLCKERAWLSNWLESKGFANVLENLMTSKMNNLVDVREIFPSEAVFLTDISPAESSSERRAAMDARRTKVLQSFQALDAERTELLALLVLDTEPLVTGLSPSYFGVRWLNELAKRNMARMRNVRPAGLSNVSVLANVFNAIMSLTKDHASSSSSTQVSSNPANAASNPAAAPILAFSHEGRFPRGFFAGPSVDPELSRLGGNLTYVLNHTYPGFIGSEGTLAESLCHVAIVLFHIGVSTYIKNATSALQVERASLQHLREIDISLKDQDQSSLNDQSRSTITAARSMYVNDAEDAVRMSLWGKCQVAHFCPQDKILALCLFIVSLLRSFNDKYMELIPECYLQVIVEAFHSVRLHDPLFFPDLEQLIRARYPESTDETYKNTDSTNTTTTSSSSHVLENRLFVAPIQPQYRVDTIQEIITVFVDLFSDQRIINTDLRETMLQSVCVLSQYNEFLFLFERNHAVRTILSGKLIQHFNNRFWVSVTNVLLRLIRGSGYLDDARPESLGSSSSSSSSNNNNGDASLAALTLSTAERRDLVLKDGIPLYLQDRLVAAVIENPAEFASFLNQLLNNLNWTLTELSVSVKDAKPLRLQEAAVKVKKASIMSELSTSMLRILEFFVVKLSWFFRKPEAEVYLKRTIELFLWVIAIDFSGMTTVGLSAERSRRETFWNPTAGILLTIFEAHPTFLCSELVNSSIDSSAPFRAFCDEYPSLAPLQSQLAEAARRLAASDAIPEDQVCTICYVARKNRGFVPCGHQACEQCVTRHLCNSKKCFFCNAVIDGVSTLATD